VSVKTRIGFYTIKTEEWLGFLLEQDIAALSIHGRTVKEMSKVPAHWHEIGKGVALRDQMGLGTVIIGNGDVESLQEAKEKAAAYGLDGIMIGRGIFKDPWLFNHNHHGDDVTYAEKLSMLSKHIDLFVKTWGTKKNFLIMRKFFKCYINGVDNASEYRQELMECRTIEETQAKLTSWIEKYTAESFNREML
jgi:tRNA-dihydrouridine synthase